MITPQQITRQADEEGVSAPTVERDYVLAHCLIAISLQPEAEGLAFKGGTALRMCYFDEYRYSADLDFSLVTLSRLEGLELVHRSLEQVKQEVDLPSLDLHVNDIDRIEYRGPLGKQRWVKLDLDEDEVVLSSSPRPFIRRYGDLPDSEGLPTYILSEIAGEKLRCVIQRLQCRDFFDLHHLLVEQTVDVEEAWEAFEVKARHKGIDPEIFFTRFDDRSPMYEKRWASEMAEHVSGELPHFERMLRTLRKVLRPKRESYLGSS